jgi:hypothetical protein
VKRAISLLASSVVAILVAVGTSATASGSATQQKGFDHHFNVRLKHTSLQPVQPGFRIRFKLADPNDKRVEVGREHGKCRPPKQGHDNRLWCHFVVRLKGDIGGSGVLEVGGLLRPHPSRLTVVRGTKDFRGTEGKMRLISKRHFFIERFDLWG